MNRPAVGDIVHCGEWTKYAGHVGLVLKEMPFPDGTSDYQVLVGGNITMFIHGDIKVI